MIYSMYSSFRIPRQMGSTAGERPSQQRGDGNKEAPNGQPGYDASTRLIMSSPGSTSMNQSSSLPDRAPAVEADVPAPKSNKLCPDKGESNQFPFTSGGRQSTAIGDVIPSSVNTSSDVPHSSPHPGKTPFDEDVLASIPDKDRTGPGLQKRSAATTIIWRARISGNRKTQKSENNILVMLWAC